MIQGIVTALIITASAALALRRFLFLGSYRWNDGPYMVAGSNTCESVIICWTTSTKKHSTIYWGESPENLTNSATGKKSRFHSARLENLKPGTEYFYTVDEELSYCKHGTILSFTLCGGGTESADIVIMGDLQPRDLATLKANRITALKAAEEKPDFIVQTGDTVQIGTSSGSWHYLMRTIPLAISRIPFLPSIGNHERYILHSSRNFRTFFPREYPDSKGSYYSVDSGPVHIIFLDPFDGGFRGMTSWFSKRQKKWLVRDLEEAVRKKSGWIFVVLHQPVFTSGEYKNDVAMRNWLIPIFSKYDVDAVFFGHSHLYEHWVYRYGENGYLLNKNDSPGSNPVHFFCIGSSGARLESSFKIFSHPPFKLKKEVWYNYRTGIKKTMRHYQYPWNEKVSYGGTGPDKKYYHYPFDDNGDETKSSHKCYSTSNSWFGFKYGEITLHYAKIAVSGERCRITVHYPDGTLLKGFNGKMPQEFILKKKDRTPDP